MIYKNIFHNISKYRLLRNRTTILSNGTQSVFCKLQCSLEGLRIRGGHETIARRHCLETLCRAYSRRLNNLVEGMNGSVYGTIPKVAPTLSKSISQ